MTELNDARMKAGIVAVVSRKLAIWIEEDPDRRDHARADFPGMVTFCRALAAGGGWMTEEEILAAIPEDRDVPHVMGLDNIERGLAYAGIVETDAPMGWTRYRWPGFDAETRAALGDFRLSISFQAELDGGLGAGDLLIPFPSAWGLRGDPFLWAKIAAVLRGYELHAGTDIEGDFRDAFQQVTGRVFDDVQEDFEDQGLAHGGMSSGWVDIGWWRRTGFPLIEARFNRIRPALPAGGFHG